MKTIVWDMDNTLADEFGKTVRPNIEKVLEKLKSKGYRLVLFTNSKRDRARRILMDLGLRNYFSDFVFREDYDPEEKGVRKDIRKVNGELLVDDDPAEIKYVQSLGLKAVLVKSFRNKGPKEIGNDEWKEIYEKIITVVDGSGVKGIFRKIF